MTDDELEAIRERAYAGYGASPDVHRALLAEVDRLRAREAELRDHVLDRSYLAGFSDAIEQDEGERHWWDGYRRAMRDTARRLGADLAPDGTMAETPRTATDDCGV